MVLIRLTTGKVIYWKLRWKRINFINLCNSIRDLAKPSVKPYLFLGSQPWDISYAANSFRRRFLVAVQVLPTEERTEFAIKVFLYYTFYLLNNSLWYESLIIKLVYFKHLKIYSHFIKHAKVKERFIIRKIFKTMCSNNNRKTRVDNCLLICDSSMKRGKDLITVVFIQGTTKIQKVHCYETLMQIIEV